MTDEARFHGIYAAARARRAERVRNMRLLKTSNGFIRLTFFSDRAFMSLSDEDGWPSDRFVRPVRRDRDNVERALRRLGVPAAEARTLADRIAGEWPDLDRTFAEMLVRGIPGFLVVGTLAVIGAVTAGRALVQAASRRL
jgi:hypothetical protein